MLEVVAALVAWVPFGDLGALGAPIAFLAGSVLRIRRGHVEGAMTRAGIRDAPSVAVAMYASLARGVLEVFWLAAGPRRDLREVVRFAPGSEGWLDAMAERAPGVGAVFASSHTGNWELTACAMASAHPVSVIVKPVSVGAFDRFMRRLRARYGVALLEGAGALALARRELRAGRGVAVLVDQVPPSERQGEWIPFLGAPALTDRTAAALAASAGAPLVVTASRRAEDGGHVVHILSVKWPPSRGCHAWALAATRELTEELDAFVRAYPDQWLWLHRRWRGALPASLVSHAPPR